MIWLLRIEWLGRTWYLASRSCEPVEDGVALPHTGTLAVGGYDEALEMGTAMSGPASASVSFILPGLDMQQLDFQGHTANTMRAELSLWAPHLTYGARRKLIVGNIAVSEVARAGQPTKGTLTQVVVEKATDYPAATLTATVDTWSTLPDADESKDADGTPYPIPIGYMGTFHLSDGTEGSASSHKLIIIDPTGGAEIGLVAGGTITASTVELYEADDKTFYASVAVTNSTDLLGQVCSVVALSGAPAAWVCDGTVDIYVTDMQGGIAKSSGSGAIKGLGDSALHLLLQRYGDNGAEMVDVGRWKAALPWLNQWSVGFIVEAGQDPLDIIADKLCTMCPFLWIMPGPNGYRPVIMEDSDPATALHLEVGRNCDEVPDSVIRYTGMDPVNSCAVGFAYSARRDKYRGKVTIDRTKDVRAAASYTHYGTRSLAVEIASYDRGTAGLTASEIIRMRWTRPRAFEVFVPWWVVLGGLCELGNKVRYTCARQDVSERPLYVQGRSTVDGEMWRVMLVGWW